MKKTLANIGLMLLVTVIVLALAEAGLRILTPFPVHGKRANKIYDRDLGYRLNLNHPAIDANGFRNIGDKPRIVAALGDSHTYGSGVTREQSWPAQFEKITGQPTYNFGVGSYAVYTYYALARRAIDKGYKTLIIALYIHNDFTPKGTSCAIDYDRSQLWRDAKQRLSLNLPPCRIEDTWKTADAPRFIRFLRGRVQFAIPSAIEVLIVKPLNDWWYRTSFERTQMDQRISENSPAASGASPARNTAKPAGKRPASWYFSKRGVKHEKEELFTSDLDNPETQRITEDFEKLLTDLKKITSEKGLKLGLLFIPSKVQIAFEYADDKDIYEQIPWMRKMALNHIRMQQRISEHLGKTGIPWATAMPEIMAAIEESERTGTAIYGSGGNHPQPAGFRAYAEAAARLYGKMSLQ